MDKQLSFADCEYRHKRHQTCKEKFLARMEGLVPWQRLEAVIEPHYPKAGNGRRPYPLITMLRIHCLQQWYSLSDPGMEDALYEIEPIRLFAGLALDKSIPDHTTIMNFRHLLERHELGRQIFEEVNSWLTEAGVLVKEGTLMDATIIEAPSSTKNKTGERDPEIHQTIYGRPWFARAFNLFWLNSFSTPSGGSCHRASLKPCMVHERFVAAAAVIRCSGQQYQCLLQWFR